MRWIIMRNVNNKNDGTRFQMYMTSAYELVKIVIKLYVKDFTSLNILNVFRRVHPNQAQKRSKACSYVLYQVRLKKIQTNKSGAFFKNWNWY